MTKWYHKLKYFHFLRIKCVVLHNDLVAISNDPWHQNLRRKHTNAMPYTISDQKGITHFLDNKLWLLQYIILCLCSGKNDYVPDEVISVFSNIGSIILNMVMGKYTYFWISFHRNGIPSNGFSVSVPSPLCSSICWRPIMTSSKCVRTAKCVQVRLRTAICDLQRGAQRVGDEPSYV